jgi:Leucine-rich repeat (LRR) protein
MKRILPFIALVIVSAFVYAHVQTKGKSCTSIQQALQSPAAVTALELKGQGLSNLPDLSALVNVERVDLSYNSFTTIPPQLYKLPKLKVLLLNNNAITALPADIAGLKAITNLRLDANPFVNPTNELKKLAVLSTLVNLNFSANKVTAFPTELLNLTQLADLDLGYGSIKTLPADIDKLTNLKRLVLTKNVIVSFPPAFFTMPKLENLDLSYNNFTSLQPEFEKMNLDVLDVSYNKNLATLPAIKGMRYINVKSTKINMDKLKWSVGESCIVLM